MNDLVSIIMPVKNTAQYLKACLNSIINQSYLDWELIAVDDFSDDAGWQILTNYGRKEARIKVFKNDHPGIIGALNLGYGKCSGNYITRMDSDDIMPEDKLLHLKTNLVKGGKGTISTGLVEYFSDQPISSGYLQYEQWLNQLTKTETNLEDIYKECPIASPCWMVFRDDFESCGGFKSRKYPEDYDLCFRFYQSGFTIKSCQKVLHLWREHQQRTSRTSANYTMDRFIDLKLDYYLNIETNNQDTIVLWSAGQKSKDLAKRLQQKGKVFRWVCTNPKKIGNAIYDILIEDYHTISKMSHPKVIVPIAVHKYQSQINAFFKGINLARNKDYFFFS